MSFLCLEMSFTFPILVQFAVSPIYPVNQNDCIAGYSIVTQMMLALQTEKLVDIHSLLI